MRSVVVLVAVMDPGLVVLGGGVGRAGGDTIRRGAVLTALDLLRDDVFG